MKTNNNMHKTKNKSGGFTIIELMIAISIFALVLMALSAVMIQIGRAYYRSVYTSRTQDAMRNISDNITRSIQFSGNPVIKGSSPNFDAVCIGSTRYTYALNSEVGAGGQALWRDRVFASGSCDPLDLSSIPTGNEGSELLSENMRLLAFSVEEVPGSTREYVVRIDVGYGDDDQMEGADEDGDTIEDLGDAVADLNDDSTSNIVRFRCKPSTINFQFCAVSSLESTVTRRL